MGERQKETWRRRVKEVVLAGTPVQEQHDSHAVFHRPEASQERSERVQLVVWVKGAVKCFSNCGSELLLGVFRQGGGDRGLRNDSKIRGKNGEWNRRAICTIVHRSARLGANLKHHT
jgi:hypothetical protein